MNSPEARPVSGLEHLNAALAIDTDNVFARRRAVWEAVLAVEQHAARDLAYCHLDKLAQPRPDLSPADVARLRITRIGNAEEVIRAFHRAVVAAPFTLAALAAGTPSPVHGAERRMLAAAVRRPMIAAGYDITPDIERKLLYSVVDIFAEALNKPTTLRAGPVRMGSLRPVADDFDVENDADLEDDVDLDGLHIPSGAILAAVHDVLSDAPALTSAA